MSEDYRADGTAESNYGLEIGTTILGQIQWGVKASLGYHAPMLTSRRNSSGFKEYGVTFKVRVLPFTKAGKRGTRPKIMRLSIYLNGLDYYDIDLGWMRSFEWVEHFSATNIDVSQLNTLLLALDHDGQSVTNPRYWSAS